MSLLVGAYYLLWNALLSLAQQWVVGWVGSGLGLTQSNAVLMTPHGRLAISEQWIGVGGEERRRTVAGM